MQSVARSVSSQIFCEEVLATYARGNEQLRSVQLSIASVRVTNFLLNNAYNCLITLKYI